MMRDLLTDDDLSSLREVGFTEDILNSEVPTREEIERVKAKFRRLFNIRYGRRFIFATTSLSGRTYLNLVQEPSRGTP